MDTVYLFLIPAVALSLLFIPMAFKSKSAKSAKMKIFLNICGFFGACLLTVILSVGGTAYAAPAGEAAAQGGFLSSDGLGFFAAALSTGLATLGAGIAVAAAAPAAIGAISEDPKSFGKALIFVALGEGVALYGLLISILIINRL